MFDYDKEAKMAVEKLNEYDFSDVLIYCYEERYINPHDIFVKIEKAYPSTREYFDYLTEDGSVMYLSKIYGVSFAENISYYLASQKNGFKKGINGSLKD